MSDDLKTGPEEKTELTKVDNLEVETPEEVETEDETPEVEEPEVKEPKDGDPKPEPVEDKDGLREQLSVLKEVRSELTNAYKNYKDSKKTIEQLSSENIILKTEVEKLAKTRESLSSELDAFKAREAEVERLAYDKRLEQLSADFTELGQEKTIEQLSGLPKEVIGEFESITSIALQKKSNEQLSTVTTPSQAIPPARQTTQPKQVERLESKDFMAKVCDALSNQQNKSGDASERTLFM